MKMWLPVCILLLATLTGSTQAFCPQKCNCYDGKRPTVDCTNANLDSVPILLNPRIVSLTLSHNQISSVSLDELSFYSELEFLDLSHNRLLSLDKGAFYRLQKLKVLKLSGNGLDSLVIETFTGLSRLRVLDLSQNALVRLSTSVFADLRRLQVLNVSSNSLRSMSPGALTGLTELDELSLDHNQLTAVPDIALHVPVLLKVLDFSFNAITSLENSSFSELQQLQHLNLHGNSLELIDPSAFKGLRNLRQLDLRLNQLFRVPTLSFRHLTELETLYIGQNPFEELPTSGFEGLRSLRQLLIADCSRLQQIRLNAFSGLYSLETLMIVNNPLLETIDQMAFEESNRLRQLLLSDNRLQQMPQSLLLNWSQLTELDLSRNPWRCDCSLLWLPSALRSVYGSRAALASMQCRTPQRLLGRPLARLTAGDFECEPSLGSRAVFTLAVLIACLIVATVVTTLCFRFHRRLFGCCGVDDRNSTSGSPLYYHSTMTMGAPYAAHYEQHSNSSKRGLLFGAGFTPTPVFGGQHGTAIAHDRALSSSNDDDSTYMSPNDFYYTIQSPRTNSTMMSRDETFRIITKYPVPITEL